MTRFTLIALLASSIFQVASAQNIEEIGIYVGASDSLIQRTFGQPDTVIHHEDKDALIWIYFAANSTKAPVLEARELSSADYIADTLSFSVRMFSLLPVAQEWEGEGYYQFAFWNGKVAAVSMLTTGPEAEPLYEASLAYLKQHANWVGQGPSATPEGTPLGDSGLTRMGDNIWAVHKNAEGATPGSVLRVGDAGYMTCSKARMSELRRVKAAFGIDLTTSQ